VDPFDGSPWKVPWVQMSRGHLTLAAGPMVAGCIAAAPMTPGTGALEAVAGWPVTGDSAMTAAAPTVKVSIPLIASSPIPIPSPLIFCTHR
jgi:hypothetical protein